MAITIDVRPEVEAELARQAALRGKAVEAYAAGLLEEAVYLPADSANNTEERRRDGSLVEVCAMVRGLTDDLDFSRNPSIGRPVDLS
ncbi:MAG: hypothetical protein ABSH56_21085 [Bryobacteraceae bacterium]|jgi:hypothetical protein